MPDLNGFLDRLYYENRREYTNVRGNVAYLDGAPLKRSFSMPLRQKIIALAIVVAAVIIGYMLVNTFVISRLQEAEATEKAIAQNLARPASIESIPDMKSLILLDDNGVRAAFNEAGYTVYDASGLDESSDLLLYRVPSDMKIDDVAADFMQGFNALTAEEASKLFVGGWYFGVDRSYGTSMVVRYVDFSTGDPQIAVHNAIRKEGFDVASITDSGVDDSGNTYSAGTFVVGDDVTCTWKVSALPLKDLYSISGLPEDACYVGVRVTRT